MGSAKGSDAIQRKVQQISYEIYHSLQPETLVIVKPDEDEIKKYVTQVIAEIKKTESQSGNVRLDDFSDGSVK